MRRALSHLLIGVAAGVLGLSAMALSSPARADDAGVPGVTFNGGDGSYKRAVESGINLFVSPDPPYTYKDDKTGQYDGIDVEIVTEAMKRLGIKDVKWDIVQFDALIPSLLSKRADVIVDNLHENPKRLAVIAFTSPVYWYGSALAVQKGNPQNVHSWDDLKGHSVGTVRGSFNQQLLEARKDLKELKLYTSNEAEFSDLIAGRVDVIMEDDIKIGQFMKAHPSAAMEFASGYAAQPQEYGYARYAVRKEDVDLNHALSRAVEEMRGDGTVGAIISKYGLTLRNLWYYPVN
jgi:polar amino acid transport system substrate-binding protein